MDRINAFRARDGKVFEIEADCLAHEAELNFNDWYAQHELLGTHAGSHVALRDVKVWLIEHKDIVADFLGLKTA